MSKHHKASGRPASAQRIVYEAETNRAITAPTTKTFDVAIADLNVFNPNTRITFSGGITSTGTTNQQNNRVLNGAFVGGTRAGRTNDSDQTITFDSGRDVTAFGGLFTGPSNSQVSGLFDGVASTFLIWDFRTQNGLLGLTSTTAFPTLSFRTYASGCRRRSWRSAQTAPSRLIE